MLASFLLAPEEVGALCDERRIEARHFYLGAHALLFQKMNALWRENQAVDFVTLCDALGAQLEAAGGAAYLQELCALLPSAAYVKDYLAVLEMHGQRREIIALANEARSSALGTETAPMAVLSTIMQRAGEIAAPSVKVAPTMKQLAMDKVRRMQAGEVNRNVLKTGLVKLDFHSPLYLGAMPLVSGERKAGKSIFSITLTANLCEQGHRGLYFSLEEPRNNVVDRLMANLAALPIARHHSEGLSEAELARLQRATERLAAMPLAIYDDVFDLPQLAAIVRQHKARYPDLAFCVVDYAQLIDVPLGRNATQEERVATASRTLRRLSMELKLAMIVLCQLNADGATRQSRALEQDATAMWKVSSPEEDRPHERTLEIPWQRGGESMIDFPLTFHGELARFANFAEESDARGANVQRPTSNVQRPMGGSARRR